MVASAALSGCGRRPHRGRSTALWLLLGGLVAGCTTATGLTPGSSRTISSTTTGTTTTATTTALSRIDWPAGVVTPFRTTQAGSAAGKRIGLISPDATDTFSRAVTDSIIAETTTAGAALIRCDPGADGEFALECAQRLSNQQVDGWIVQRTGWEFSSSLCAAGPRDVPMIVVNGPPGQCTTATVTADDTTTGRIAGSNLGQYSQRDHDCAFDSFILITDPTEPAASTARAEGIRAGFRQACPDRLAAPFLTTAAAPTAPPPAGSPGTEPTSTTSTLTDSSQRSAASSAAAERARVTIIDTADQKAVYDTVQRAVGAHPDSGRIVIAAVSDGPALTAVSAVRAVGRIDDVRLVAIGADERSRCEIARNPRWLGDAALFPDRYGELVVPALVDAMDGRRIPQAMLTSPQFLDAANVSARYDVSSCPEIG